MILLIGCSATPLASGAGKVRISYDKPPKGSQYIGVIEAGQGNFFTGAWTSNKNLQTCAMNRLRNKASKLGGNYVRLITNRASSTAGGGNLYGAYYQQTGVLVQSNVYRVKDKK